VIIIKLNGGLGNQMFQYATARSLAYERNVALALDINAYDTCTLRELEINRFSISSNLVKINNMVNRLVRRLKLDKLISYFFFENEY